MNVNYRSMIRATYITFDKTDGSHIHVFSVFEQMMPDMQDAEDVGNRVLLPDNKRPSGFSATKDNLTFHARILPDTTQWNDVVSNPMSFIDVDSNNVQYHADADMLAVECDVPSLFNFIRTPATTLLAILPYRACGGRISRYFDQKRKVWEEVSVTAHLRKQLQFLSKKYLGYDLTQYPEHVGNVHLIRWNPLFRDVDCWTDLNTGKIHLHFLYYNNSRPDIVVRASGINQAKALLFDQELCKVGGEKYIDVQLPTIPKLITLHFYDADGFLWMECTTTGRPLQWMGRLMMVGQPTKIKTKSKSGKERIIETQKGEMESFGLNCVDSTPSFLKEEIEHQRFISDEGGLQFLFFDGDQNHKQRNERRATRIVRDILKKESKTCFICDPYFDYYAFDKFIWPLEDIGMEVHIVNCKEFLEYEDKLKNTINSYHQHIKREQVKCHVVWGKGMVHDRFILLDNDGWLIGSSFNEFGNRASTIVKMPNSAFVTISNRVKSWIKDSSICKDLFEL